MEREKQVNTEFTRQAIEDHLQSALAAATPDLWPRLEQALKDGAPVVSDGSERDGFAGFPLSRSAKNASGRQKGRKGEEKYSRIRRFGAAAAACACLLGAGGWYHYEFLQVASQIEIDVNPSLKLSLNRRERVLKVQAQNDDGERIAKEAGLKGKTVRAAVDQVVDSLIEQGYLEQGVKEHSVLVSVSGKTPELAEQVKTAVAADMESALARKEVKAVVYDQVIQVTDELEELAQEYRVSLGKAEFIGQLVQENVSLSENRQEAYSRMMSQTMEELSGEIDRNSYQVGSGITVVKTEQASSPAGEEDKDNQDGSGLFAAGKGREGKSGGREGEREKDRQTEHAEESAAESPEEAGRLKGVEPEELGRNPEPERPGKRDGDPENLDKGGMDPESPEDGGGKPGNSDASRDGAHEEETERTDMPELGQKGSGSEAIRRKPLILEETEESEEPPLSEETEESGEPPLSEETEESEEPPLSEETEESKDQQLPEEAEEFEDPPLSEEAEEPEGQQSRDRAEESKEQQLPEETGESEDPPPQSGAEEPEGQRPSEETEESEESPLQSGAEKPEGQQLPEKAEESKEQQNRDRAEESQAQQFPGETKKSEEPPFQGEAEESESQPVGKELDEGNIPEEEEDGPDVIPGKEEQEAEAPDKPGTKGFEETGHSEENQAGHPGNQKAAEEKPQPESAAPAQPEFPEPGQFWTEDEEEAGRVIRTGSKVDPFEPGDMAGEREDGQTVTSSGTRIIFEASEKKIWEEPVYASQYLTGSERSLLQMGPGVFFGRVSPEDQEGLLQLGPGFAFLYENPSADWDESYLWGGRIVPRRGKVYRVEKSGKKDKTQNK